VDPQDSEHASCERLPSDSTYIDGVVTWEGKVIPKEAAIPEL